MDFMSWSQGIPAGAEGHLSDPSQLPALNMKVGDSFSTAPGYRELDVVYTCVPDVAHPWDPKIMKMIWKLAPDAVPLWVQWVFMSPADTGNPEVVVFGRHGLGRCIRNNRVELPEFRCAMPSMPCAGLKFEQPNMLWFIHEGDRPKEKYLDLPGEYLGFDHLLLEKVKTMSEGFNMSEAEYKKFLFDEMWAKPKAEHDAKMAAYEADMEARADEIAPYIKRQLDAMSEADMHKMLQAGPTPGR